MEISFAFEVEIYDALEKEIYGELEKEIYGVNEILIFVLNKVTSILKGNEGPMESACGEEIWNVLVESGTAFQEKQIASATEVT